MRGSKRAGFDFTLSCSWAAGGGSSSGDGGDGGSGSGGDGGGSPAVKGTFKIADVGPEDLDDLEFAEVVVLDKRAGRAAEEAAALAAARALLGPVREALAAWYEEELKQR